MSMNKKLKKLFRIHEHPEIPRHKIRRIQTLKREKFHPVLHHTHKKHRISYRTLYYIKSYGKEMHVWHAILRQSLIVVLLSSVLSTFGGIWLQSLESKITVLIPLIIMIPALNDMIGDFGTILSSKFSTYLFTGRVGKKWWKAYKTRELITSILLLAVISAAYIAVASSAIAIMNGFPLTWMFFFKLLALTAFCTVLLSCMMIFISFAGGYIIFKRGDDPNNFLIPITTATADFTNLLLFSYVVLSLF